MDDFENNIQNFTEDFRTDTGLDHKTNVDTYIQYVQARLLDNWMQQQNEHMTQLITQVRR